VTEIAQTNDNKHFQNRLHRFEGPIFQPQRHRADGNLTINRLTARTFHVSRLRSAVAWDVPWVFLSANRRRAEIVARQWSRPRPVVNSARGSGGRGGDFRLESGRDVAA